ncbi:MAG: Transposase protein [Pedosphaera sp.]|nr:Transposase protein [Pedosphaera sp.]
MRGKLNRRKSPKQNTTVRAGLDVVFAEDQSRARTAHAAENLAALRRLAVGILRKDKQCKRSLKGKLMRAAIDPDHLQHLLTI